MSISILPQSFISEVVDSSPEQLISLTLDGLDVVSLLRIKDSYIFSYEVKMVLKEQSQKRFKRMSDTKSYECPICLDLIALAHICHCGTSFCYACMRSIAMTAGQGRCAMCKAPWSHPGDLTPNLNLDAVTLCYAETFGDVSIADQLKQRIDRYLEVKRRDVRMDCFTGEVILPRSSLSAPAGQPSTSRLLVPQLVERLELYRSTPPHPSSEPELVDLSTGVESPLPRGDDCTLVINDGVEEASEDDGPIECDGEAGTLTDISPNQPLRKLAIGKAPTSFGLCQHCRASIEKDSTRLVFQGNGKSKHYLHFECIGAFNSQRKSIQGAPISYLSIFGRESLPASERLELRRAVRGQSVES